MKKFRFQLEKLLEYREQVEERARKDYLTAKNSLENMKKNFMKQTEDLMASYKMSNELKDRGSKTSILTSIDDYTVGQREKIKSYQVEIRRQKQIVEEKLNLLYKARKSKRAIEILKEKKYNEFRKQLRKQQENEIEELMTMTHNRGAHNE